MLLFLGMFGVLGKEVSAKGKEERLPDGRLLLETSKNWKIVKVGNELYFMTHYAEGVYSIKKNKVITDKKNQMFKGSNIFKKNLFYKGGYFYLLDWKGYYFDYGTICRYNKKGKLIDKLGMTPDFLVTDKYIAVLLPGTDL